MSELNLHDRIESVLESWEQLFPGQDVPEGDDEETLELMELQVAREQERRRSPSPSAGRKALGSRRQKEVSMAEKVVEREAQKPAGQVTLPVRVGARRSNMIWISLVSGSKQRKAWPSYESAVLEARKHENAVVFPVLETRSSDRLGESRGSLPYFLMEAAGDRPWKTFRVPMTAPKPTEREPRPEVRWFWTRGKDNFGWSKDKTCRAVRRKAVLDWLSGRPNVEFALAKNGQCCVTEITKQPGDKRGWLHLVGSRLGLKVKAGGKVVKRLSQLSRPYTLFSRLQTDQLSLVMLTNPDHEKPLDGMVLFGLDILEHLVDEFVGFRDQHFGSRWVRQVLMEKILGGLVFNGRALLPRMQVKTSDGPVEVTGLLKGQWVASPDLPPGTILFHRCNLKTELEVEAGRDLLLGLDPQPGHDEVKTSLQYIIQQPQWFAQDLRGWLEAELDSKFQDLKEGKTFDRIERLLELLSDEGEDGLDPEDYTTRVRLQACEFVAAGGDMRSAPWLTRQVALAGTHNLVDLERMRLRVRVPQAVHWQVISSAMARLIDPGFTSPREGHVKCWERYRFVVLGTSDYLAGLANHGSPDQDDFYDVLFRQDDEGKVLVGLFRHPNFRGGFSVYGLDGPAPRDIDLHHLPVVSPPEGKQWDQPITVVGGKRGKLPSAGEDQRKGQPYGIEDLACDLARTTTNPGGYVNAVAAQGQAAPELYNLPYELDEVVDVCQQGGTEAQIEAALGAGKAIIESLVNQGRAFDEMLWECKRFDLTLGDDWQGRAPVLVNTRLGQDFLACAAMVAGFVGQVKTWIKDNQLVLKAAAEQYYEVSLLQRARELRSSYNRLYHDQRVVKDQNGCTPGGFEVLNQLRMELLAGYKDLAELVPVLGHLVHSRLPKDGVINDEILMGRLVWQHWIRWLKTLPTFVAQPDKLREWLSKRG